MESGIIEKLVLGKKVSREEIENELYEICCDEHASCNNDCPIFRLNKGEVPKTPDDGCTCFKNGKAMYDFILEWKERAEDEEER